MRPACDDEVPAVARQGACTLLDDVDVNDVRDVERLLGGAEGREGLAAFLEKRKPVFRPD